MSTVTHRCAFCDSDYPCATFVDGTDEQGRYRSACECKSTDECPGCSEHGACEDCGKAPAGDERDYFKCSDCAQKAIDNYEPSEPDINGVSMGESMDAAYALDRSQK